MFLATDNSHGLRRGLLRSLLSTSSFRLVVSELQMYRVLPGVLFGAIASYARTTLSVDETIQQLDSIFGACNSSLWIGTPAGRTRSKYAQSGTELYGIVCSYFFAQSADDDKQRQALQFMRVVSGLIGHLRLDVKETFLDAFKRTERFVLDSNTADMSASLLLVLVGFGSQVTAHGILNAISGVENHLVAARIDSIIAHLLTDHIKPVVEFVNSVLGMDFVYPRERLFYFKDIVTQSKSAYFSGAAIARRLLSRDYYKPSDSLCCSQFQRAAILYFLQAEIFQENGIDVREWFSALIWNMDAATANEFGVAIKAYVSAVFSSSAITPIPETAIWKAFSPEAVFNISSVDSVSPAQVLYLLYLLYYCENLSDQSKGPGSQFLTLGKRPLIGHASTASSQPRASTLGASLGISINHSTNNFSSQSPHTASTGGSSPPIGMFGAVRRGEYSDQLLDSLPVSWILRCVNRSPEYQLLWPELLSMATAQFPDQLDVVAVLQHELSADSVQQSTPYMSSDSEPRIEAFSEMISDARSLARCAITDISNTCVRNTQLFPLLSTIEQYFKYPAAVRMETCSAFSGYLCRVALQNHANDEIVASICQAWFSLHELNPHIVSTATANSWRTKEETTKPKLIPQDVWLDPLVLFRSDSRIFESPGLTDILLTVLAEFLVLSRTSIRRIHSLRQRDNSALKMSHVVAMVQLQESSALQILIELASFSQNDAVRALIFEFIHARFLEQRVVQKLVHFQAYELTAIDDMVKHVPSMHACSEFIPEMLMQSLPRLQLFSIRLAASITSNYPIVANEGMTKEVILPHIQTTLTQVSGTVAEEQLAISNAMFEAVIRINNVFPLIRQDCMRLVNAVRTAAIEKAQTALQDNQQQHGLIQNIAKWVGSCDKVLEIIGSENPEAARPQYTQIEDISADEFVSVVESTVKLREKSKHVGHKPTLATNSIDLGGSQQPGAMTSQTPGMLPTPSPNQAMPQPHGAGSATLGNAKRSHSAAMSSDADHSSRMVPLSTGKRETGGSVEFGRGRSTFVNPGASRGSPAAGPLSDLAGHGNAAAMYTHSLPASSAQMSVSSGPGTSAGFKKRSRHRSRPPPGGKEINGTKTPAIGIKRAKVPGGERQQRSKDP
ncbi:Integrator complex subunit 2 [Coemansia sp. RSA 487]|nr:Integrator complex subunit 2 [Coemansia sp. RSA 487]